ncbi:hypothetical protein OCF66_18010, partial [Bacillus toyonensis]|uniref:hypothetical protein n=1 Tax=Bacillus toyonensis TaxID=155322 RepID=UPI0021D18815
LWARPYFVSIAINLSPSLFFPSPPFSSPSFPSPPPLSLSLFSGPDSPSLPPRADRKIKFILINMAYFSRSFSFYVDGDR